MRMLCHFATLILVALQPWHCVSTHPSAVIQADGTIGVEADSFSRSKGKHLVRSDRQRQDLGHEAESTWVNASFLESTMKEVEEKTIDGIKVLLKMDGGKGWVLLMKLSKNDFCYGSARWKDGKAFKPEKMLDKTIPGWKEYDAKSLAFHKLEGLDAVKLQTDSASFEAAPEVHFKATGTAEKLITTNSVGITSTGGFNSKSYWDTWTKAFKHSRNRAPAFMRAGKFVSDPKPACRTNPQDGLSGCGKPCVFCMQANDGEGCPARSHWNDISKGIGLHAAFCGGGDAATCSCNSVWAGQQTRVLVWGRLKEMPKEPTEEKSSSAMCRFVIFLLVPGLATFL